VRLHGDDRYGVNQIDQRVVNWDLGMSNRHKLLEETGNSLEDALYASPLLNRLGPLPF
jgi:hypothetical protein